LGHDRTGSPVSSGNFSACHGPSSVSSGVAIAFKNTTGASVTQYTPGATYTLELTVSGTSGSRRAVQGVVLTSANSQAGTLSGATGISAISTVSGRQYLEHSSPATSSTSSTFSATWVAPIAGTGSVTVYSTGLAANNNSSTSGDIPSNPTSFSLPEKKVNVFTTDSILACDSITWIDGVTYTANNNIAKDTINLSGYDSIISLKLTIATSTSGTDIQTACGSYTWINGTTYTASNSTAKDTIPNAAGCDSIINLNLTVNSIDTSLTIAGTTFTSNQTGATYQWLDCNNSYAPISGQTNASYSVTSSGNYAVSITKGTCVDTSRCISYDFTTITENEIKKLNTSPNPFSDIIFVEGINLSTATVQLFNISGKEYSTSIEINNKSINTTSLPKGIYILSINGKTSKVVKF
jgi:hypothetical protein